MVDLRYKTFSSIVCPTCGRPMASSSQPNSVGTSSLTPSTQQTQHQNQSNTYQNRSSDRIYPRNPYKFDGSTPPPINPFGLRYHIDKIKRGQSHVSEKSSNALNRISNAISNPKETASKVKNVVYNTKERIKSNWNDLKSGDTRLKHMAQEAADGGNVKISIKRGLVNGFGDGISLANSLSALFPKYKVVTSTVDHLYNKQGSLKSEANAWLDYEKGLRQKINGVSLGAVNRAFRQNTGRNLEGESSIKNVIPNFYFKFKDRAGRAMNDLTKTTSRVSKDYNAYNNVSNLTSMGATNLITSAQNLSQNLGEGSGRVIAGIGKSAIQAGVNTILPLVSKFNL